jgi:hypothetical protein
MLRWGLLGLLGVLAGGAVLLYAAASGWLGRDDVAGTVVGVPRSPAAVAQTTAAQAASIQSLGASPSKQVLFGDFHVHTTFSFDAFLISLPMTGGAGGSRPPADACDFARYCSALDFWSINDHAENLTQHLWTETVDSVRQCNAVAGDPANPDLVTYLGWEWSQIGTTPDNHYGHKNVVLLETGDGAIPTRPISSTGPRTERTRAGLPLRARLGLVALNGRRGIDFTRLLGHVTNTPQCPQGVPVRDLPLDCMESATTPELLFEKLDDWGLPSFVIPHGTAWGIYTPAGSDWRKQLAGHDPKRQTLVEIYSGHGNSEQLPPWRSVDVGPDGTLSCPAPSDDYLPSCWQAGVLIEARCLEVGEAAVECQRRAAEARQNYVEGFQGGWKTLPGFEADDWLDSGQDRHGFQPAFNYRPRSSVQYMLAVRDFSDPAGPKGFEFGFIGSSDTHTASSGNGYREFARGEMTEGRGAMPGARRGSPVIFGSTSAATEPVAESVPFSPAGVSPLQLFELERASAYFVTGGLVAVHAQGRNRNAIWDALQRKEVYATSGRRTLLWFDLIDASGSLPMGSSTVRNAMPRFRVRAAGSFEQKPGCPDHSVAALGAERIDSICRGNCYHPSDTRRPITRIEIVKIRPQVALDEPLDDLIEDPWRTFPCPADGSGCVIEFADADFAQDSRDTVYYARAIEAPAPLIHGNNPLGCNYDESGSCTTVDPCAGATPVDDDCLSEGEPRAWSSPIFVKFGRAGASGGARGSPPL